MVGVAWLVERLALRRLVNQEGITLLMATLGIANVLDGAGQLIFGSATYKIDVGMPKDPLLVLEGMFEGGLLLNKEDMYSAVAAAALVVLLTLFFQKTRHRPRPCAPWPTTTKRRSRSAFRSGASGSSCGRWAASSRWLRA